MRILVLNTGSSSLKFRVIEVAREETLAHGVIERIGEAPATSHREALDLAIEKLGGADIDAVGHRVVHGGERFREATLFDRSVRDEIERLAPLAPLHNPSNLLGIDAALERWPDAPQVVVFDTAFHHTIPERAHRYAIPEELRRRFGIRRYGFHGTSHAFVARRAARFLGRAPGDTNLITLHLGNGASATAIENGRSVDTSMGMTPLEGLVMGTRTGDLDPSVPGFLARATGRPIGEIERVLDEESGLQGLCGASDMRDVLKRAASGDAAAVLALDVYAHRVRKYVGAYTAVLGRVDALLFTAGIGENAAEVRERCTAGLEPLGFTLDPERNRAPEHGERAIHHASSRSAILVIPTDEELEIAHQTQDCVERSRAGKGTAP